MKAYFSVSWPVLCNLCAIAESFRFGWPVVLCLLSLVQFFLSFPWKYFCARWLIQEVWVHWGSAIIYCFLHLKAGTFNTSNFCLVSYFWDCWDFLTGHGVLFCQSAARNISFLHLKLLWSPPSILILLASFIHCLLLQVVKKPTLLDSSRGCQKQWRYFLASLSLLYTHTKISESSPWSLCLRYLKQKKMCGMRDDWQQISGQSSLKKCV